MPQQATLLFDTLSIYNALPGKYVVLLPDAPRFTIVAVTDSFSQITQVKREDLLGKGFFEVFTDNIANSGATGAKNLSASLHSVLRHKQAHAMPQLRYDTLNTETGAFEYKVWRVLNKPVLDKAGNVEYIINEAEDITQNLALKEREKEAKRETEYLLKYINATQSGMSLFQPVFDDTGAVIDFRLSITNYVFAEYIGKTPGELEGCLVSEVNPTYLQTGNFVRYKHTFLTGERQRFEARFTNKEKEVWIDILASKMEAGVLVTIVDLTTLKKALADTERHKNLVARAAERLEAVFNASQSGMFTFAPVRNAQGDLVDFRFVITNTSFAAYVNQAPAALVGTLGSTWFPGYLHNGVFDMYKETYLTGSTQRRQMHYNVDGYDLYLDLVSTKVGDEVLVNFNDYTLLHKAQLQLETFVEELKRSNASLEEFAHVTSHDLQEPLRKIQFFTNFLLEKIEVSGDARKYSEKVNEAARRMSGLITDLLDYARLSQSSERFETVDLNAILKNVLSDYELLIAQKGAVIQYEDLENIQAVPLQVNQLFFNLVGNGLKFIRRNVSPVITIKGQKLSAEKIAAYPQLNAQKAYYEIVFQDNGIGFQQEYADKIFAIFQRLNERSLYGGYGIGLALCKRIVDAHKGIIYASGKPQEGAVFTVILPYLQK